jgi:hypothetical protein
MIPFGVATVMTMFTAVLATLCLAMVGTTW